MLRFRSYYALWLSLICVPSFATLLSAQPPAESNEQVLGNSQEKPPHPAGAESSSVPLLTVPKSLYFEDHFSSDKASPRWFFNEEWSAENGVLRRGENGSESTRIFLKNAEYHDCIIRFDFRLLKSKDVRLVTGNNGHYNAVIHIRSDHFFIQTALDRSVPHFPMHHGECAFYFHSDRWYTMTIEFIGDELVAHIDHDHLAYAKHPILDTTRQYFAFQVDQSEAELDNIQIQMATVHENTSAARKHIRQLSNKNPVERSREEKLAIEKKNAHARLYLNDENYRQLVTQVDELDAQNKKAYPAVFKSHKEFQKGIQAERKRLLKEDPNYKELLHATHRSKRAIESFLLDQKPEIKEWPDSRRKRELGRLRRNYLSDSKFVALTTANEAAQQKLQTSYPQVFITNEQYTELRNAERKKVQTTEEFKRRMKERADALHTRQTIWSTIQFTESS